MVRRRLSKDSLSTSHGRISQSAAIIAFSVTKSRLGGVSSTIKSKGCSRARRARRMVVGGFWEDPLPTHPRPPGAAPQPRRGRGDHNAVEQTVQDGRSERQQILREGPPEPRRQRPLWIEIHEEDALILAGQAGSQVDR